MTKPGLAAVRYPTGAYEISHPLCGATDVPLRGPRGLCRRLEGRRRGPEWTGSRA